MLPGSFRLAWKVTVQTPARKSTVMGLAVAPVTAGGVVSGGAVGDGGSVGEAELVGEARLVGVTGSVGVEVGNPG